jgi:hypothetical protein
MSFARFNLVIIAAAAAVIAVPAAASAQSARPAISVNGGMTEYDLSGVGRAATVGVRAQLPVTGALVIEPGLNYMQYNSQGGTGTNLWFPEVQLQAELPLRTVRPYLGIGAGAALISAEGQRATELTFSSAAGVRVALGGGWGVGGELRIRAIDPWAATTADFGLSISRRLGPVPASTAN